MTARRIDAIASRTRNAGVRDAAPIIYIHGAMCDGSVWQMLSGKLGRALPEREGWMLDLPGHGNTPPLCSAGIREYAAAVEGFMADRGIEKAVLVGHSMGGAIAQQIAIDRPSRVEWLVLLSTGARLGVSPQIIQVMEADFQAAVSMMKDFLFAPATPDKFWKPAVEQMGTIDPQVALADFAACNAFDVVGKIDKLRIPAIVCCGENDFMTSPKKNRLLAESLACEYVEFPATGHMIQLERAAELAEIVSGYLI